MKTTTTRGTPYNFVGPAGGGLSKDEGFSKKLVPDGMSGAVPSQYAGDQTQMVDVRSGTPYVSATGNADETLRGSTTRWGISPAAGGVDMNDAKANGNGVLFDGVSAAHGMRAGNQPQTLDSPVPIGAQLPLQDAPKVLNNLRSGMGAYFDQDSGPKDSLIKQGGVMSHD